MSEQPSHWQGAQHAAGGYQQTQQGYSPRPGYQQQYSTGYQPQYATPLEQPQWGAPATILNAGPARVSERNGAGMLKQGRHVPLWGWMLLGVILLLVIGYFAASLGTAASAFGFALALVPLGMIIVAVHFIDRWEPEPPRLLIFAFGWGAIAAIAGTLLIVIMTDPLLPSSRSLDGVIAATVVRAPIIEEIMKGLGLLIILAFGKRAFDGPVDGIVYGALIGAGFAFTENIQYFGVTYLEQGAEGAGTIFFLRGILSPFCHVMFTACTGFMVGLAARSARRSLLLPNFIVGLAAAMALHAFWNGSSVFAGEDWFLLYVFLQVPLFVCFIIATIWLRRQEARLTRQRLGEYAVAGWFTAQEVEMLATSKGRAAGLAWARTLNGNRVPIMKTFIQDAAALAATRQRALSGRDPQAAIDEQTLLMRTQMARTQLLAY